VHLRSGQRFDVGEERSDQLVKSGVSQLHLRFDADQSNDFEIRGAADRVVEQRGLAHAGFAPQDERGAESAANRGKELSDLSLFVLATDQKGRRRETATARIGRRRTCEFHGRILAGPDGLSANGAQRVAPSSHSDIATTKLGDSIHCRSQSISNRLGGSPPLRPKRRIGIAVDVEANDSDEMAQRQREGAREYLACSRKQ